MPIYIDKQQGADPIMQWLAMMQQRDALRNAEKARQGEMMRTQRSNDVRGVLDSLVQGGDTNRARELMTANPNELPQEIELVLQMIEQQGAEATAAQEQDRLAAEKAAERERRFVLDNELVSDRTIPGKTLTGATVPTRWEKTRKLDAAEKLAMLAASGKLNEGQLKQLRASQLPADLYALANKEQEGVGPTYEAGLDKTKSETAENRASAESSRASAAKTRQETKFAAQKHPFEMAKTVREAAAEALRAAGSEGLDKENYGRLSGILKDANADVEKPIQNIKAVSSIIEAMANNDGPAVNSGIVVFMKALDDSVAREGEVDRMVKSMGGRAVIENNLTQWATGKASKRFADQVKELNRVILEKERSYLGNVLSRYDIQVEAAGPEVGKYWEKFRNAANSGISVTIKDPDEAERLLFGGAK